MKATKIVVILLWMFCSLGVLSPVHVHAGKGPYPVPMDKISADIVDILIKHGMPVKHDREDPWLKLAASTGNYKISFYQAEEVPQEAIIEVVRYCMNLYEKGGRKDKFKILLYRESFKPQLRLFSDGNVYFKLTIGGAK